MIGKHYVMIRETIKRIVIEVLFNPTALDEYLQDERNNMTKLLNIGWLLVTLSFASRDPHMIFRVHQQLIVQ